MVREVREETGLDIGGAPRTRGTTRWRRTRAPSIFRRYFLDADADEVAVRRIRDFVAGESATPEIEEPGRHPRTRDDLARRR